MIGLIITRIILAAICFVGGVLMIVYRERIARVFGKNDLAEKYLGAGGTYNMWVVIGILVFFLGAVILLGKLEYFGL